MRWPSNQRAYTFKGTQYIRWELEPHTISSASSIACEFATAMSQWAHYFLLATAGFIGAPIPTTSILTLNQQYSYMFQVL